MQNILGHVMTGSHREDLISSLQHDPTTCIIGENIDALGNLLLPEVMGDTVLAIAAESHALYGRRVAEAITLHLQRQNALPAKYFKNCVLMIHELLSNAIEYGSLDLSQERKNRSASPEKIAQYYEVVEQKLEEPQFGNKPILLICTLIDEELYVKITDEGRGFSVEEVSMNPHEATFGRGLYLVKKFAQHSFYENKGRTAVFTLPSRITVNTEAIPSRLSIKKNATILLVEDLPVNLEVAREAFEQAGYQKIYTANTGADALEKAVNLQPNLIFLNTYLSDMDGFSVCQQLKGDLRTKHIPVLFASAVKNKDDRAMGYRLGAVDFINKPFNLNELVTRSEVHILNNMMFAHTRAMGDKLREDLDKARDFQAQMLPSAEKIASICAQHNVLIRHEYQTSENLGGDYWTAIDLNDQHIAICLVDFTGHGLISAMNTIRLHAFLNELNRTTLMEPEATARALNNKLFKIQNQQGMFATFLYIVLNTFTGEMHYAGCGAPGMFIIKENDPPVYLDCSGFPIGLLSKDEFEVTTHHYKLEDRETFFIFSDALVENIHKNGKRWLLEGLQHMLVQEQEHPDKNCATCNVLRHVKSKFNETACQPIQDDLTMVSVTYQP